MDCRGRKPLPCFEVEEIKVVTKLTMASRKTENKNFMMLMELEKMQANFRLN
jgi:hypothetical protein